MPRRNVADRFWSKVDIGDPDACWPWTASRNAKGYGQFRVHPTPASPKKSPRVAWELTHGVAIPAGLLVCHACDNPPCCNPGHLFLGTSLDNTKDRERKGRSVYCAPDGLFIQALIERQRVLGDRDIMESRHCYEAGESCRSIARRLGVAHTTISRLINGTHWATTVPVPTTTFRSAAD